MLIAVDLDDTLCNSSFVFWDWHRKKYGFGLKPHQITNYYWPIAVKEHLNIDITFEETFTRSMEFLQTPESIDLIEPIKFSFEVLQELKSKLGLKLVVITIRSKVVAKQTKAWVHRHFNGIFEDIIFTDQFSTDCKTQSKSADSSDCISDVKDPKLQNRLFSKSQKNHLPKVEVCNILGADILIDDAAHHFVDFDKYNKKGVLLTQPWNKEIEPLPNVNRAKDWREVYSIIKDKL